MKRQFVRSTSGWIPVSVLLLLIIALAAGQADAELPGGAGPASTDYNVQQTHGPAAMTLERRQRHDDLPFLVDAFLVLALKLIESDGSNSRPNAQSIDNPDTSRE